MLLGVNRRIAAVHRVRQRLAVAHEAQRHRVDAIAQTASAPGRPGTHAPGANRSARTGSRSAPCRRRCRGSPSRAPRRTARRSSASRCRSRTWSWRETAAGRTDGSNRRRRSCCSKALRRRPLRCRDAAAPRLPRASAMPPASCARPPSAGSGRSRRMRFSLRLGRRRSWVFLSRSELHSYMGVPALACRMGRFRLPSRQQEEAEKGGHEPRIPFSRSGQPSHRHGTGARRRLPERARGVSGGR